MLKTISRITLISAVSLVVCLAAVPVANVSSPEPFKVHGVSVPVAGVSSWPILSGDDLVIGNAPAVVTFKDGSRVTLGKNSRAAVEGTGKSTALRLFEGAMAFTIARGSGLRLFSAGNLVSVQPGVAGTALAGSASVSDARALLSSGSAVSTAAVPTVSRRR